MNRLILPWIPVLALSACALDPLPPATVPPIQEVPALDCRAAVSGYHNALQTGADQATVDALKLRVSTCNWRLQ